VSQTTRKFRKGNGSLDELTIVNSFEYDHAGRPTKTIQQIGSDQEVVISELVYNELGQVVKKHLHQTEETNSGMQVVDYRYNERGWLTKINNADLVNDGDNLEGYDVFGEELIYHEEDRYYSTVLDMHQQFNGNIGAIKWKTNRNPDAADGAEMPGHSYVFRYDKLGQMLGAFYAKSMDTYIDNYSYKAHSWDEKASYDANGNIMSMMRKRPLDENGTPYGTPAIMDQLSYTYMANSNKVLTIQDSGQDNWISNSASNPYTHFIDNNAGGTEYTYDTEGRTLTDANKGLGFEYNHLDLVKRAYEGSEAVNFVWDATGQKLKKTVGTTSTYYFNGIEYTNDELTSMATSEGIARMVDDNIQALNLGMEEWVYDYYLKDHLGNVRAIITEEGSEPVEEKVTVELEKRVQEDANFDNVSATEKDKPYFYPYDPADPTSQKVSELNSLSGKVIGPAKVLSIEAGETIDLSAKYWYTEAPGDPLTSVAEILAGTLLNLGAASGGIIPSGPETGMALLNNVSGDQFGAFNTFINDAFDNVDFSKPQAYLVYMYFNKNMELDASGSGVMQVGDANALGQLAKQGIVAKDNGFFYTYVTNRSAGKVSFDNMTIKHWAPVVRVVYDYYPYGLTWENPALPTDPSGDGIHDCAYQDKEFQFAEFTTGHSLALYDFHARMYDPCTARWLVPDPAAQFANPYLAMGNNPVSSVDPDGRLIHWAVGAAIGAVVGGIAGGVIAVNSGGKFWEGAIAGAIVGAAIGMGLVYAAGGVTVTSGTLAGGQSLAASSSAWNIASNALITGSTNVISSALQGRDWHSVAVSGMIGLASGAIGGAYGNAAPDNAWYSLSKQGLGRQNALTSALNGAADRYLWSVDAGLEDGQVIKNTILGGLEGLAVAHMSVDEDFLKIGRNSIPIPGKTTFQTHSTSILSRYLSTFSNAAVTSVPGAGFALYSLYPTSIIGRLGSWNRMSIALGVGANFSYNAMFYHPMEDGEGKGLFGTYPFPDKYKFYGSWDLFGFLSDLFK
jgi:RHS repeat-associated protein